MASINPTGHCISISRNRPKRCVTKLWSHNQLWPPSAPLATHPPSSFFQTQTSFSPLNFPPNKPSDIQTQTAIDGDSCLGFACLRGAASQPASRLPRHLNSKSYWTSVSQCCSHNISWYLSDFAVSHTAAKLISASGFYINTCNYFKACIHVLRIMENCFQGWTSVEDDQALYLSGKEALRLIFLRSNTCTPSLPFILPIFLLIIRATMKPFLL